MNTFPCNFNYAKKRWNLVSGDLDLFFNSMCSLKNKRKLAAVNTENQEKHPWNKLLRDRNASRFKEEYITQASDETASRVTEKTSQEFSRTKSQIFGSFSKLDEFLLNWQVRTGKTRNVTATVPGMILILKCMLQLEDPLAQWTQTLTLYFTCMDLIIYDYAFPVWYLQNYQIHFRAEMNDWKLRKWAFEQLFWKRRPKMKWKMQNCRTFFILKGSQNVAEKSQLSNQFVRYFAIGSAVVNLLKATLVSVPKKFCGALLTKFLEKLRSKKHILR